MTACCLFISLSSIICWARSSFSMRCCSNRSRRSCCLSNFSCSCCLLASSACCCSSRLCWRMAASARALSWGSGEGRLRGRPLLEPPELGPVPGPPKGPRETPADIARGGWGSPHTTRSRAATSSSLSSVQPSVPSPPSTDSRNTPTITLELKLKFSLPMSAMPFFCKYLSTSG
uniref:Putative secreted protein n=1 Tax=Ixodes ricinus TaxID=34613 RepID=A0A6B0UZE1_IXORI